MTTHPHTLPIDFLECPSDCPFLGMRTFLPNTLPFYCNKYETFLGANPVQKILRCAQCRGVARNNTEAGLAFIASYIGVPTDDTRRAFLLLSAGFQRMFVDLISKTGIQVVLSSTDSNNPTALADDILKQWKENKDKFGSPEVQAFAGLLDSGDIPRMGRQMKSLLMNVFQVLDTSEKEMLKHILQNTNQVKSFLDSFERQPQDNDLLKNVRALLYDYDRKSRESVLEQQRQQEDIRRRQEMNRLIQNHYNNKEFSR